MVIFEREQRSLFGEILDWMLIPLLVIWPMGVVLTYLVAQNIADRPFDRALEQSAQTLAGLVMVSDSAVQVNLPRPAKEILRADDTDQIFYQVQYGVSTVAGERSLPLPATPDGIDLNSEVHLRSDVVLSHDVRVAYMWLRGPSSGNQLVLVQVAETLEKRKLLASEIIKGVTIPQFFILPLALLLIWVALSRTVRPLSDMERSIRQRKPDDLHPLEEDLVPKEVAPLVDSVNDLLQRLTQSIGAQKRFLADAAHQLKTPLAGLRMQADLAQREQDSPQELKKSLQQIEKASVRATHTVNQLLSLARAESNQSTQLMQPCNLVDLLHAVAHDVVPHALAKKMNFGFEVQEDPCWIHGNPTMLQEMLRNLVDNAINYTPTQGDVTLRLLVDPFGKIAIVQVEDNGPGIAQEEREAIFQPFYRSMGTQNQAEGSGLGLSIVQEVAKQHRARLTVELAHPQNRERPGSCFSVRFRISQN